jgi:hypothetical protein
MFRKTVLGLGAALILTAAVTPTAAFAGGNNHHNNHHKKHHGKHHGGHQKWHGGPGIYIGSYGGDSCVVKKIKVWDDYEGGYYLKKKVVCY